jgi:hypothetical protein
LNALPISIGENASRTVNEIMVCGLPGQRLGQVVDLVRQAFDGAFGACTVLQFNELTEDTQREIENAARPLLLWADCPRSSAVEHMRTLGWPTLMVDCDFENVAREFLQVRQVSMPDTLRVLALCRMGWWHMARLPQASHVGSEPQDLSKLPELLSTWVLPGEVSPSSRFAVELLSDPEPYADVACLDSTDARAIADLAGFYGHRNPDDARRIDIPISAFLDGAPPHAPLSPLISLVGPARALSFGPFFYLPEGDWRLTLMFEATGNFSCNTIKFDIFVDGRVQCQFLYSCEFSVENPWSPFEFRSHMAKGSIGGEIRFEQPVVQKI